MKNRLADGLKSLKFLIIFDICLVIKNLFIIFANKDNNNIVTIVNDIKNDYNK